MNTDDGGRGIKKKRWMFTEGRKARDANRKKVDGCRQREDEGCRQSDADEREKDGCRQREDEGGRGIKMEEEGCRQRQT